MKPLCLGLAAICLGIGCWRALGLGTDLVWSSGFESGDLSEWSAPPGIGGDFESPADARGSQPSATPSTAQAHSGMYSVKFSSVTSVPGASPYSPGGGCLYKGGQFPQNGYYSAWYFIPAFYETLSSWTLLKFMVPNRSADAGTEDAAATSDGGAEATALGRALGASELFDLNLLSLPDQTMTLVLFDARHVYLESPLPDPVPHVPIGRWFQVEAFYRNDSGPNGELTFWLDGLPIYDVVRPTGGARETIIFALCSLVNALSPQAAVLYADDVAISWSRVTPRGVLAVSP